VNVNYFQPIVRTPTIYVFSACSETYPPDYNEHMMEEYGITEQENQLLKLYFDVFRYTSLRLVTERGKVKRKGQYYNKSSSHYMLMLKTACHYKVRYANHDEIEFSTLWKNFIQTFDTQTPSAVSQVSLCSRKSH